MASRSRLVAVQTATTPSGQTEPVTALPRNWIQQVLAKLPGGAAPDTPENETLLTDIFSSEHGGVNANPQGLTGGSYGASNNPLDVANPNVTEPGEVPHNSNNGDPVYSYANWQTGLAATEQFLSGSSYQTLDADLRAGNTPIATLESPAVLNGQWSGAAGAEASAYYPGGAAGVVNPESDFLPGNPKATVMGGTAGLSTVLGSSKGSGWLSPLLGVTGALGPDANQGGSLTSGLTSGIVEVVFVVLGLIFLAIALVVVARGHNDAGGAKALAETAAA